MTTTTSENPSSSASSSQATSAITPTNIFSPTQGIDTLLEGIKIEMKDDDLVTYIGDAFFQMIDFVWDRIGIDDCLMKKNEQKHTDTREQTYVANDESPSRSDTNEANPIKPEPSPENTTIPISQPPLQTELAEFSIVVKITYDDFWLIPCGLWNGPTKQCKSITDLKLSCTGCAPSDPTFMSDYNTAVNHIRALMAMRATPGHQGTRGVIVPRGEATKIKFRHALFEPKFDDSEPINALGEPFTIAKWPTYHNTAREALDRLVVENTHELFPLPAYGHVNSKLIEPQFYRSSLQDATVRVHFTLKHWYIGEFDTYVADMTRMQVLIPPNPSPRRKRVAASIDPPGSPSPKKTRT